MAEAKAASARWEAAAADAVARADRLADLLEEAGQQQQVEGGGGGAAAAAPPTVAGLEAAWAAERARCARLEARCAALCVEAGRAAGLSGAVAAAVLPALAEVEDRLDALSIPTGAPPPTVAGKAQA